MKNSETLNPNAIGIHIVRIRKIKRAARRGNSK